MVINDVDVGNGETRDFASVTELDSFIAELRERSKAEVAAAYKHAASICGVLSDANLILSRTPADASRAFELAILDARIEEVERTDHGKECLKFNMSGIPTGLDCNCRKGKRHAYLHDQRDKLKEAAK